MESCYFFIDMTQEDIPDDQRKISVLCVDCRNKHWPDTGWFWDGEQGYGPWDYKCSKCGHLIHQHKEAAWEN